jgi:hypothetical protein
VPSTAREETGEPLSWDAHTLTLYSEVGARLQRSNKRLEKKGLLPSKGKQTHQSRRSRTEDLAAEETPKLIGSTLGIPHIYIKTAFCHPIKFNYIPPPNFSPIPIPHVRRSTSLKSSSISECSNGKQKEKKVTMVYPPIAPCNFCDRFFGLTGLMDEKGPREVEGFYYPDGSGFEEVSGGFSEEGLPNTRMCVSCTTERIRIMGCSMHKIRHLKTGSEIDARVFDDAAWAKAYAALQDGDFVAGKLITEAKWCSICPWAATSVCCASQADGSKGCGLMLCEKCDLLMEQIYKGGIRTNPAIISAHIREMGIQSYRFPTPRADATFLTPEGELMVRLQQGMGQKMYESEAVGDAGGQVSMKEQSDSGRKMPSKKDKGKGKDWSCFDEELRPKGWNKSAQPQFQRDESVEYDGDGVADIIEVIGKQIQKVKKAKPKGEIEFGGALNEDARAELDKKVARAFGAQRGIIDLTGDDD